MIPVENYYNIAGRFHLIALDPDQRPDANTVPNMSVYPNMRAVRANAALLWWVDEPELTYILGHEAGHLVHSHLPQTLYGRFVHQEIEADVWGVLALRAHGYRDEVAIEALERMEHYFPSSNGEGPQRITALRNWIAENPRE